MNIKHKKIFKVWLKIFVVVMVMALIQFLGKVYFFIDPEHLENFTWIMGVITGMIIGNYLTAAGSIFFKRFDDVEDND